MTNSFQDFTKQLIADVAAGVKPAFALAGLNEMLTAAPGELFAGLPAPGIEDPYLANYVAAMVEQAAYFRGVRPPAWTAEIAPLDAPVFSVPYLSLRAHLLLESPVPFRRRNIFTDSGIGTRV